MRQFDAILDAAAERGFEAREDVDVAGRRHVDLATVEPPTLPTYRLSLSLTATVSSTGSIRVRYDFHLGTPCLLDPVGGDGFRERGASG